MPIWISVSYCLLACLYIWVAGSVEIAVGAVMKILPLLLLLGWFCGSKFDQPLANAGESETAKHQVKSAGTVIIALGFSMLGDVILAVDGKNWFVFGLGAFLLSHIAYIAALKPFQRLPAAKLVLLLACYAGFAAVVLGLMAANLGSMLLPVSVYIAVILLMSLSTWHSKGSNPWLVVGGLLFICSDAAIGLNRFYTAIPFSGVFIMLTYYAAQYSLLRGFKLMRRPMTA